MMRRFGASVLGPLSVMILGAAIMVTSVNAHQGATGIVKERMDLFKRNQQLMKAMGQALAAENFVSIAAMANEIEDFAINMPDYFPRGSTQKPTEASAKIWTDFITFKAAASANAVAAGQIVLAANAGDAAATKAAIIATGASCKSCHVAFRVR